MFSSEQGWRAWVSRGIEKQLGLEARSTYLCVANDWVGHDWPLLPAAVVFGKMREDVQKLKADTVSALFKA